MPVTKPAWREHRNATAAPKSSGSPTLPVGWAALTVIASSLAAVFALHLWNASLGVPLLQSGDALIALMQIKGVVDNGWVLSNPHLAAPFGQDLHDFAATKRDFPLQGQRGAELVDRAPLLAIDGAEHAAEVLRRA